MTLTAPPEGFVPLSWFACMRALMSHDAHILPHPKCGYEMVDTPPPEHGVRHQVLRESVLRTMVGHHPDNIYVRITAHSNILHVDAMVLEYEFIAGNGSSGQHLYHPKGQPVSVHLH